MPDNLAQSREDVALANRILANEGIFDAFAEVLPASDSSEFTIADG